jgi:hypothetical protein
VTISVSVARFTRDGLVNPESKDQKVIFVTYRFLHRLPQQGILHTIMSNLYAEALEEARKELAGIVPSIERLSDRRRALESLIAQLEQVTHSVANAPVGRHLDPDAYLWKKIAQVMFGLKAFTLDGAGKAIEATGHNLGPNRPQKIRNSVIRHPEIFRRNEDGSYTVIREVP